MERKCTLLFICVSIHCFFVFWQIAVADSSSPSIYVYMAFSASTEPKILKLHRLDCSVCVFVCIVARVLQMHACDCRCCGFLRAHSPLITSNITLYTPTQNQHKLDSLTRIWEITEIQQSCKPWQYKTGQIPILSLKDLGQGPFWTLLGHNGPFV